MLAAVPRVVLTPHLVHLVGAPTEIDAEGTTVRDVLESAFRAHPRLRGYVLDDQGGLRPHMTVFVGLKPVADRRGLADPVPEGVRVTVMQALSGG